MSSRSLPDRLARAEAISRLRGTTLEIPSPECRIPELEVREFLSPTPSEVMRVTDRMLSIINEEGEAGMSISSLEDPFRCLVAEENSQESEGSMCKSSKHSNHSTSKGGSSISSQTRIAIAKIKVEAEIEKRKIEAENKRRKIEAENED